MKTVIGAVVLCLLSTQFAVGQSCTNFSASQQTNMTDVLEVNDGGGPDQDIGKGINNGSLFVIGQHGVTLVIRGNDGWGSTGANPPAFPADGTTGRIAVGPDGTILARDSSAGIWTVKPGATSWTKLPGVAADVAITSDGTLWSLNMTAVTGGFQIQRYSSCSGWTVVSPGSGTRIAGGPDAQPWVVGDTGHPWHRNTDGSWTEWTGLGQDIGIDDTDSPWVVGYSGNGNGVVFHWFGGQWVCSDTLPLGAVKQANQNPSITGGPGPAFGNPSGSAFFLDNGTVNQFRELIHEAIQH